MTVFGESAGSVSINWHLLSEESRQYFQRVILQVRGCNNSHKDRFHYS